MNGLSLRISGGNKLRAPIAALPPVTLPSHHVLHFQKMDTTFEDFIKSSSADAQLNVLKNILKVEMVTEEFSKFLAVVFLSAEPKHPIKCYLARHITKTATVQDQIFRHLTQELLDRLTPSDNYDISSVSDTVTAVISCSENFPTGSAALKTCEVDLFLYLERALRENLQILQNDKSLSPTEKNEIYNLTHNILRALLTVFQNLNDNNLVSMEDSIPNVYRSLDRLLAEIEVPMDTKSLCAIVKVTILGLEHGKEYWTKFLVTLREIPSEDTDAAIETICIYSAIITVVPVKQIEHTKLQGTSCLQILAREVLKLSEKFSVEPLVALCVARTLLSLTKALQKSEGTAEGISSAVSILSFVWAHVEHFMDSVRHLTSQVLSNVLKYFGKHQNNGFPKVFDVFFSELMTVPINKKAYYVGLSASASVLGAEAILKRIPGLIQNLIDILPNHAVQSNVATTMEVLLHRHIQEVSSEQIYNGWIRPILRRVYESAHSDTTVDTATLNILENVIAKAVRWDASIMDFILPEAKSICASGTMTVGDMKCALVCLNLARRMGSLDNVTTETDKWKGILSYGVIRTAMVNSCEEIRILAMSLLIETSKSTEPFTKMEFDLLLLFLKYNINTQAPNMRHLTLSLMKKLMKRLESSHRVVKKQKTSPNKEYTTPSDVYTDFLRNLRKQCFDSLLPGANYSRRAIALQILVWCEQLVMEEYQSYWCEEYVEKLLLHLEDSYENNKMLALDVLTHCPAEYFETSYSISLELNDILGQASSVKPPDCVSAAYKLQLIQKIHHKHSRLTLDYQDKCSSSEQVTYVLLKALWSRLKMELEVARDSILVAASRGPMYGLVFCARHLLTNLEAENIAADGLWTELVGDLIGTCIEVTAVVAPVVNNSSPEGHLPMDSEAGAPHLVGGGLLLEDGARVTAQMVLLCAWRCVKEVSLLLGEISSRLHIRGESKDLRKGNLSHDDILLMGDHFTTLLAETKHRGAFEQAYVGFTKLCARLWKCGSASLHGLPRSWLAELMEAIASGDRGGKLCSTRRSAGVPFMIQALVTTELQVVGNPACFHECMATLLRLASFQQSGVSVETRTHCLNILRSMFRHTALGEVVNSYVGSGLVTAIRGFDGNTWAERNSSTLLFSSLMVRIFGVQRSKDSDKLCIRNKMTGRTFFLRYPTLYDFMLEKLQEVGSCAESRDLLRPSLYPVLLLLARLYPYSLEESTTNLKLVAFIPHVLSCGGSCVLKTRQLAAKAIVPLISHDKYIFYLNVLLNMLEDETVKKNLCHGILLQLIRLLEWKPENLNVDASSYSELARSLTGTLWILEDALGATPCYVTADEYSKLLHLMIWRFPTVVDVDGFAYKVRTVLAKLFSSKLLSPQFYGKDIFMENALNLYIILLLKQESEIVPQVVVQQLNNDSYDVVRTVLNFVLLLHNETDEFDCKFLNHIQENIDDATRVKMLSRLAESEEFRKNLFGIVERKLNLECIQKALTILSHCDDTQAGLLCLNRSRINTEDIITGLLGKIQNEHENVSHIYIISLRRYLMKVFVENVGFDERLWLEIARMLYDSCSSDNTDCKRRNVVDFLEDHLLRLTSAVNGHRSCQMFEYHSTIWATIVVLLEDDDESLRQRTSSLVLKLAHSMNIDTSETYQVIPSRAAEILLDVIMKSHNVNDAAAIFLVLALLDFNSEVCIEDDITEECRVFDQNEKYNTFLEETNWTKECLVKIMQINNSTSADMSTVIGSDVYDATFQRLCTLNYIAFTKLLAKQIDPEFVNPKVKLCIKICK